MGRVERKELIDYIAKSFGIKVQSIEIKIFQYSEIESHLQSYIFIKNF